jgi:UDP-glucose 4-epimerase
MEHKTILVTGGAGFVGSNLIARLVKDGHRVISLDNYFAGTREAHVAGAEYREGHTKDIATHIPEAVDLIFHLGEYSRVEQSVLEPELVHDLNTVGTAAVIEFWKARRCKLVYAGSSTKFGDGGATRYTSPYAETKAANTELVREVGEKEKLPYAITYFYNVFGPGERSGVYGTVIQMFKQMYERGTPITVVAPGTQLRNFTHVDDIVDGILLVAERGQGDEYGLGNPTAFSLIEIANLFGGDILMLPERPGNRMQSALDTSKIASLGWKARRPLRDYVADFLKTHQRGERIERRVLVFTTTFFPTTGPAEDALAELIKAMPGVQFDIITTTFSAAGKNTPSPLANAHIYRIGRGRPADKYLLPILGARVARRLHRTHQYLFAWSLMASYAALAALAFKRISGVPVLITLADQRMAAGSFARQLILAFILRRADQVHAQDEVQGDAAAQIAWRTRLHRSMGEGDAFANQIRFAYAEILAKRVRDLQSQ